MIEKIIKVLKSAFPKYRIYTENVEQGLKNPCFSVFELSAIGNRHIQNVHLSNRQFMIQYFPASEKESYYECSEMLHNLLILLVDIGKFHAHRLNGEIVDGVLHFDASYKEFKTLVTAPADKITSYTVKERVK